MYSDDSATVCVTHAQTELSWREPEVESRVGPCQEYQGGAVRCGGRERGQEVGGVGGGVVIIVFSNSFFKHGGMGLEGLPVSSCAVVKVKASPPPPPALVLSPRLLKPPPADPLWS